MPIRTPKTISALLAAFGLSALSGAAFAQSPPPAPSAPAEPQTVQVVTSLSAEEVSGFLQSSGLQLEALDVEEGWAFSIAGSQQHGYPPTLLAGEMCDETTDRCSLMVFTTRVPNPEDKAMLVQVLNAYNSGTILSRAVYNPQVDAAFLEYPVMMAGGVTLNHLNIAFSSWPQFWAQFNQVTGVTAAQSGDAAPAAPAEE
ncbi:MAG: hypothetical protein CMK09_09125 [Ponticaulis sp.]|nr:hypothetical protein [Ponticaulis sp.]|tara:strand:- start:52915 stop:53514 length:600 start_codon:yes stop_codon:yes gene_type:complete